eukprot:6476782-Amphidinium_carterae.1
MTSRSVVDHDYDYFADTEQTVRGSMLASDFQQIAVNFCQSERPRGWTLGAATMVALWLLLHALGYDIAVASAQSPGMISVVNMVASMPLITTAFSRTHSGCPARNSECTYAVDDSNICIVSTQSEGLRYNSSWSVLPCSNAPPISCSPPAACKGYPHTVVYSACDAMNRTQCCSVLAPVADDNEAKGSKSSQGKGSDSEIPCDWCLFHVWACPPARQLFCQLEAGRTGKSGTNGLAAMYNVLILVSYISGGVIFTQVGMAFMVRSPTLREAVIFTDSIRGAVATIAAVLATLVAVDATAYGLVAITQDCLSIATAMRVYASVLAMSSLSVALLIMVDLIQRAVITPAGAGGALGGGQAFSSNLSQMMYSLAVSSLL